MLYRLPFTSSDTYLKVSLKQKYEQIDVLSLSVASKDLYPLISAQYGCVVGRITSNDKVGIPNVKVCVFIPTEEIDENFKLLYPFDSPHDKNDKNIRFNLLPNETQHEFHTKVGTFPSKNEILDNPTTTQIFDKYYKFSTITNNSGDFLLMNVPVGNQTLHIDCDLSDIGYLSVRPYDMIAEGYSEKQFVNHVRFKSGTNLDNLPQIISLNTTVDVLPFWGDNSLNEIGFTKFEYNIPFNITPHAVVFGSLYGDNNNARIKKNCQISRDVGLNCGLIAISGNIEILVKLDDGSNTNINISNSDIDDNGNFVLLLPMLNKKMVTNENGELIPSSDGSGIATEAKARLRISNYNTDYGFWSGATRMGSYLIPNMFNDFSFDDSTTERDFYTFQWKKYYTVSQYIPRFQHNQYEESKAFLGFSKIGQCENTNPLPYNRLDTDFNPFYIQFYIITKMIVIICKLIALIPAVNNPVLRCSGSDVEYNSSSEYDQWQECVMGQIALEIGVVRYQFFNDWINGSLYFPRIGYKQKKKDGKIIKQRFCDYNCNEISNTPIDSPTYYNYCYESFIVDKSSFNNGNSKKTNMGYDSHGLIYKKDDVLYYSARWDDKTTNLSVNQKDKLLLATNFMELGSVEKHDVHKKPQIIRNIDSTSYNQPEGSDTFFDTDGLYINHIHSNGISLASQTKIELVTEEDDLIYVGNFGDLPDIGYDVNSNSNRFIVFDRVDTKLRKYLCENFKFYDNDFIYKSKNIDQTSPAHVVETNGVLHEITVDKCLGCDDKNNPADRMHPYYFYFGVVPNKTVIDMIKKKYV